MDGCIGLVAAMPQEIAPLLGLVKGHKRERKNGFTFYRFEVQGTPVVLVESGMGPKHARAATEALIAQAHPAVILNFGFGGAVLPGLGVGAPVLAERVYLMDGEKLSDPLRPDPGLSSVVRIGLNRVRIPLQKGCFITAAQIMNKRQVARQVEDTLWDPVLEMETAAVLQAAEKSGVPVVALRTVSDAAGEELEFSLEEFCDKELNIRLWRILLCVAKRPRIVPQLLRLSKNSKTAGENLAVCVDLALKALAEA